MAHLEVGISFRVQGLGQSWIFVEGSGVEVIVEVSLGFVFCGKCGILYSLGFKVCAVVVERSLGFGVCMELSLNCGVWDMVFRFWLGIYGIDLKGFMLKVFRIYL